MLEEKCSPDILAAPKGDEEWPGGGVSFLLMTASPHEVVTLFNV